MLPPVLEIYVVWHPDDGGGRAIATSLIEHFHGNRFSGLMGGAIEVFSRSCGWRAEDDAPRPIPFPGSTPDTGLTPAEYVAVVPVAGNELAFASQDRQSAWYRYIQELVIAAGDGQGRIGIFPTLLDEGALRGTAVGELLNKRQLLARPDPGAPAEAFSDLLSRDLALGLTRLLGGAAHPDRICVFISHTKRAAEEDEKEVQELIQTVRRVIGDTRLDAFFDANDLQPGEDWDERLRQQASQSALLVESKEAACQTRNL